jgi:23S rRNA pseudouridine2604 synthase
MRLNQFIAECGLCSRREADRKIEEGEVTVNGTVAVIGMSVSDTDDIKINGAAVKREDERVCILVNKPAGITSTTDLADKTNIINFVNYPKRLFTVGRLDKDSEGAILLTNDGNLVNALLRAENGHEKVYSVKVDKPVTAEFLEGLARGVKIYNPVRNEHTVTLPCEVKRTGERTFEITLKQGLNRQIRRMCSALGYKVVSLVRIKFLFLNLDGLPKGKWRKLTYEEIRELDFHK